MKLKPILSECWTGYKQVGMKNKGGRQVPNCVPESVTESSKEDIIKDLDKAKNDLLKKVDVLIAKKKKLYSDVDIESPMSADEKKLDKDIADLFSDINKLVLQKRSLKESELKGYLAADVVDDIVKAIGSKMVKGYVENAPNRNYIYLKLTDIKFGNDVVKMLKSKFGIDAKVDKTFGNIPTVSFSSNKVISEAQAVSGGKVHKLITGKNLKFKGKSYNQIDFETLGVDNNNGTIRLRIIAPKEIFGNEMSLDFRTIRRGPFFKTDTNNQFSESKTYKKGDKLKIKLPNGKKFDVVFVDYSRTKGVALGKFKDSHGEYDTKPFNLDTIVESVNEEKVYIDFLNKAKGFKQDRIKFNSYEAAVKWARKNFEKFSPDMIKFESVNELSSNVPKIFVKTAAVEKKIKELMADRKRAVVPYNNEKDPKKKEILKQVLIKLTNQIKGYEKNLIQLRDMEEEYIQQLNANAELEVESKN